MHVHYEPTFTVNSLYRDDGEGKEVEKKAKASRSLAALARSHSARLTSDSLDCDRFGWFNGPLPSPSSSQVRLDNN